MTLSLSTRIMSDEQAREDRMQTLAAWRQYDQSIDQGIQNAVKDGFYGSVREASWEKLQELRSHYQHYLTPTGRQLMGYDTEAMAGVNARLALLNAEITYRDVTGRAPAQMH